MKKPQSIPIGQRSAPGRRNAQWGVYILLIGAVVLYATPIVWMLSTSIKPESQAIGGSLHLLPQPASTTLTQAGENYSAVWNDPSIDFPPAA